MEIIQNIFETIKSAFLSIFSVAMTIKLNDVIDIALFAYIIYKGIILVRETRAMQLVKGILLVGVAYVGAIIFDLKTITFLFENLFQFGVFAILVVFQPELRRVLEKMGRSNIKKLPFYSDDNNAEERVQTWSAAIEEISSASERLSGEKVGAIMVVEKETMLSDIADKATIVDSAVSMEMLCNLFFPNSPLHDGAVIIRAGRIHAAGCFLPSSDKVENKELGSRHRAAVGMSENSDAIVIVVSEETGTISVAQNGMLSRNYTGESLKKLLVDEIIRPGQETGEKKTGFWRSRSK